MHVRMYLSTLPLCNTVCVYAHPVLYSPMYICMYACWHCRYDVACRCHNTHGVLGLSFNAVTQVNKFT